MIQVYKFGGASVKDAEGVKNLAKVVSLNTQSSLLIVISAMGKTTNALEKLTYAYVNQSHEAQNLLDEIKSYHDQILTDLFNDPSHPVFDEISNSFIELDWILEEEPHPDYDFNYDQIVSVGELVSTKIVSAYLNYAGLDNQWIDARGYIQTDNTYREGVVDWNKTTSIIQQNLPQILAKKTIVTQGFIGGTSENFTTTLGREGSDYSAAIFASALKAESVTIWKDVPGVLNADPKLFNETIKFSQLPYTEAMEMSYYGATVIHPKTIRPLFQANIPLFVKPFLNPEESGTIINNDPFISADQQAIIVKKNQVLTSFFTRDFSFISEEHLSAIFAVFASKHIKINMMQISALSFSVCFDYDQKKFEQLLKLLNTTFRIKYNADLELYTIRYFRHETIDLLSKGRIILMEQLSRNTAQFVLK
ncbi:aspartate kinase [Daejeonella oryzae]|uniref:aspartate kinase n=1 Tax=Daejeonella oryzae TaxID=1122943 RepID=UPI000416D0A9|nr:aspartate kinase [Daejeonella oryzae]